MGILLGLGIFAFPGFSWDQMTSKVLSLCKNLDESFNSPIRKTVISGFWALYGFVPWIKYQNSFVAFLCFIIHSKPNNSTCIPIQYTKSNHESYLCTAWTASPGEKHPLNTTSVQLHHKAPPCMSSQYTNTQWCSLLNIAIQLLQV